MASRTWRHSSTEGKQNIPVFVRAGMGSWFLLAFVLASLDGKSMAISSVRIKLETRGIICLI